MGIEKVNKTSLLKGEKLIKTPEDWRKQQENNERLREFRREFRLKNARSEAGAAKTYVR
ncbi:MAG: hypothetical protein PHU61_02840 [Candidatus Absconditabacteria bacterium]|nr:hypothetical protein [Candidatus Absconditabacteria bacterium]MDD3868670.1 hypothetical protein [Candidatus Absconditabacteria bacterium]MDD4714479.1 hypothetical protein [Candidatus Absconditabacteria bacterium]